MIRRYERGELLFYAESVRIWSYATSYGVVTVLVSRVPWGQPGS